MANNIKSYSQEELVQLVANHGWPNFRATQLISWLYQQGVWTYDEMTNLPKKMRESLQEFYPLVPPVLIDKQISQDESRKYLLQFGNQTLVEAVGMPSQDASRLSVCVSTQVGCSMGCVFCATGQQKTTRNLDAGEIMDQVLFVQKDFDQRASSVVVMGQGEPFLNYDATLGALRWLNATNGLGIGARHLTVSTSGIIAGVKRFATEPEQFTLAVSLHSADQEVRNTIMPGLKNQSLHKLREALREYVSLTNRRVSLEYILISGVNDSSSALEKLLAFCDRLLCHVNLIPLNASPQSSLKASSRSVSQQWQNKLSQAGIETTVRASRGTDISGACGQLHAKKREAH